MACINPDGKLSDRAIHVMKIISEKGKISPEELAALTGRPLFQIRSSLRELKEAGLLIMDEDKFTLSEKGREILLTETSTSSN